MRAEKWFLGHHIGHWPPDSAESELEAHFYPVYDILVGQPFYDSAISGHGRFYAVVAFGRFQDAEQGRCPLIITSITSEEGGVVTPTDARTSLGNVFPWIQDAAWSLGRLPEVERKNAKQLLKDHGLVRGYWWDLESEPYPFHNGRGLLEALPLAKESGDSWELLTQALGSRLQTDQEHWIGFRYPARDGGLEWLVVSVVTARELGPNGGVPILTERKKREYFENARVRGVRLHSCRPEDLRRRNTGVVNSSIADRTIALVGLGALGSVVADLLAKAGVGHFRLCDHDRLSAGNVARHIGGLSDFGAYKTRVVKTRLFEINPYLSFTDGDILTGSAVDSLDRLRMFLEPADLIVSTTADENVEAILNQVAVDLRRPVLYARALRRGRLGRVFLVRPGQDACKECLAGYARAEYAPPDWITVTESEEDILVHECGRPVVPGSAMDLTFIASLCARVALDYLEGKASEKNHWIWSAEPAPDVDNRLDAGLQILPLQLKQNPNCHVCREPEIQHLLLSESAKANIFAMAEASPDAESCGILIGYVDDQRRAIVVRAVGPGPGAERSKSLCDRDPQFAQQHLEVAVAELGPRGRYLGEWHSHLEAKPRPSPQDITSLFGIARAPNYLNCCPVMVIAGLDTDSGKVQDLHVSIYPLNGRSHTIPYEVIPDPIISSC
jgi:integrative and conjugative element protein (TIGR02256 family)